MINILFLDHQAEVGGGEVSLIGFLKTLDKKKFNPTVYLGCDGPLKGKLEGVGVKTGVLDLPSSFRTLRRAPSRRNPLPSMVKSVCLLPLLIRKTRGVVAENQVDVVFANTVKSACFGIPAARRAGVKSVWIIRDYLSGDFYHPYFLTAIKILAKGVDHVICVSEGVKKQYTALTGFRPDGVSVVYNGVDLKEFNPRLGGGRIRRELSLGDKKVVSLVGRLEPWKGQKDFIKAAELALKEKEDIIFLVVGGPLFGRTEYERECKEMVEKMGLEGKVLFLGFREDVPDVIAASDIVVHTSTLPEPFGRDIIEAMAAGKPVISTNLGGPREIITPESGILIEPERPGMLAQEVIGLLDNPERMKSLSKNARKRAEELFNINSQTKKIENILQDLCVKNENRSHHEFVKSP